MVASGDDAAAREAEETPEETSKLTIPAFSSWWAGILCCCNFTLPGFGTCTAGITVCTPCADKDDLSKTDLCHSALLQFAIALMQLLLTPVCLLGWVWSCIWGCGFIALSKEARKEQAEHRQNNNNGSTSGGRGRSSSGRVNPVFTREPRASGIPLPPPYTEEAPKPPTYEEAVAPIGDDQQGNSVAVQME